MPTPRPNISTPHPDVVKRVGTFFSREADSLRSHLASMFENDHSDLSYFINTTAECISDVVERFPALKNTIDTFNQRCELFMETARKVPAFNDVFDWAQREAIQEDFSTNYVDFGGRLPEFVKMINAYGVGPSEEASSIATTNTRFATFDDNSRDHVIKQVFDRENAHLMFWDVSFGLQLTGFSQATTRDLIRLASELTARVNATMKESEAATMQKQVSALNLAIGGLPIPNVSPHRFDALRTAVDSFFEQRVGRLFGAV